MVNLAHNEECTPFINGPLFHWAVSNLCYLRPSQGPFILGLISSIWLLTARYWPFLLVGQIQPVVTVDPFVDH